MEGPTTLRTQDFRVLLDAISKSGRRAITLAEFYQDVGKVDVPRRVILRHDVDNDPLIAPGWRRLKVSLGCGVVLFQMDYRSR